MNDQAEVDGTAYCRLCGASDCRTLTVSRSREFVRCGTCSLVFVPERFHLSPTQERARYDLHNNSAQNPGYLDYLRGIRRELARLPISDPLILDFGCGAEGVLTAILRDEGADAYAYDPLYGIGEETLSRRYDIVILCEVIEHLRNLRHDLGIVQQCCVPDGFVVVRTLLYDEATDMGSWWYAQDLTHINFFHRRTIEAAAECMGKALVDVRPGNIHVLR